MTRTFLLRTMLLQPWQYTALSLVQAYKFSFCSVIFDAQLDEVVISIKRGHSSSGEIMIAGHLRSRGLVTQCLRLRASLHHVDAAGIKACRLKTIQQCHYDAAAPKYVWHIDGTHKLIKWKFVTDVAIAGFS